MKRIISVIASALIMVSMSACKNGNDVNLTSSIVPESSGENYTVDENGNIIDAETGETVSDENLTVDSSGNIVDKDTGKVVTSSEKVQSNSPSQTQSGGTASQKESEPSNTTQNNTSQGSSSSGSSSSGGSSSAVKPQEPETTPQIDFDYTVNKRQVTITKYKGPDKNVVIPKTVTADGVVCPVVAIGSEAFKNSGAESVTLLDNFTEVSEGAFKNCATLKKVTLPDSITSLGEDAFYGCSSLVSLDLPNRITSIGKGVFYGCSSLVSLDLPKGVSVIPDEAFYGCSSFKELNVNGVITEIGYNAFCKCKSLEYAPFTETASIISNYAFYDCTSLKEIQLSDNLRKLSLSVFGNCNSLVKIDLGNGLTEIGGNVFRNCTSLRTLTFPAGFKRIAESDNFVGVPLLEVRFLGNAPEVRTYWIKHLFPDCEEGFKVYYKPGTSGWGKTFYGAPTAQW